MAVIDYTADIQKLYVAYFNRPADYKGLSFWNTVLNNGSSIEFVSETFAKSPEYAEQNAGKSYFEIVNQIYLNLFNREADVPGMEFWAARLEEGTFTVDQIVKVIADNASDTDAKDKTTYANKVAAATAFTAELNTASEIIGYSGNAANAAAKNWLSTVGGTEESLNKAIDPAALASTVAVVSNTGMATGGSTQNLTTGVDTLTGTSGNDTFVAVIGEKAEAGIPSTTTLTALDSITGGAGVDTLQINALVDIDGDLPSVTVSGVEIVSIRGAGAVAADVTGFTGIEQLNVTEARGRVDLEAGATTNISAVVKGYEGNDVEIDGGKDVVVRVTDNNDNDIIVGSDVAAKGIVNVESVGKAAVLGSGQVLGDISVYGGTTVNVNQVANGSTAALGNGEATTHVLGNIYVEGNASTTTVNVKQTATVAAQDGIAAVAETTEVASVKFSALVKGQSLTIAGLTFTADKNLTAAQVAAAFSNLIQDGLPTVSGSISAQALAASTDGDTQGSGLAANGTYKGSFTGWTSAAANGDTVVFTSVAAGELTDAQKLKVTGSPVNGSIPAVTAPTPIITTKGVDEEGNDAVLGVQAGMVGIVDKAGTIKTATVDGYGNYLLDEDTTVSSAISGSVALETLNLSNSLDDFFVEDTAATLNLNLNKIGTAATSLLAAKDAAITLENAPTTLNVKSTGNNYIDLDAHATETMNVSGTGTLKADVVDLASLKTIVVTETAGLNTGSTLLAGVTSVNTTGTTGSVRVVIDGGKASYAGGEGVDRVTIAAETTAITKSINLGAGDDTLNLTALDSTKLTATGASIVLEGGAGTDILALSSAAAGTLSATPAFEAKFNGFERLSVGELFSNTTVNMDNMDDINYVITNGNGSAENPSALPTVAATGGNTAGRPAITESAVVGFKALAAGQSYTVAGRVVTAKADGAGLNAEQVAALVVGATDVDTADAVATGAVTNWTVARSGALVTFTSATPASDVENLMVERSLGAAAPDVQTNPGQAPVTETNVVQFVGLTAGQSFTVGGRTVTASGAADAAAVAAAFISGTSTGTLAVSGALDGWTVENNGAASNTDALFRSTTPATDVAALTITGKGASGANVLTLDKMLSDATVRMDAATNVVVKLASTAGTADVVNLIANAGAIHTATVAGVETINITVADIDSSAGVSTDIVNLNAAAATTINVSGAGNLVLNVGAAVVADTVTKSVTAINGSTATGNLTIASSNATDAVAVTITGGSGDDVLTASGNKADVLIGGAGADTLVSGTGLATLTGGAGNDLFKIGVASANVNSYATITDFAAGDLIQFVGATSFTSAKVSLGDTAVFQDYANAAINALAAGQIGWFQLGGNTYVVADMGDDGSAGFVNGKDFIVKLTGTVDLSNASFNSDFGTIGLI